MPYTVTNISAYKDSGNDDVGRGYFILTNTGTEPITVTNITTADDVITPYRCCSNGAGTPYDPEYVDLPQIVYPDQQALFTVVEFDNEPLDTEEPLGDLENDWNGTSFTITTAEEGDTIHTWVTIDSVDFWYWFDTYKNTYDCEPSTTTTSTTTTTTTPSPTTPPPDESTTTCSPCMPPPGTTPIVPPIIITPPPNTLPPTSIVVIPTSTFPPQTPLTEVKIVTTVAPASTTTTIEPITTTTTTSPLTTGPRLVNKCVDSCLYLNF